MLFRHLKGKKDARSSNLNEMSQIVCLFRMADPAAGSEGGGGGGEYQQDYVRQHGETGGGGEVPGHLVGGETAVPGSHLPPPH